MYRRFARICAVVVLTCTASLAVLQPTSAAAAHTSGSTQTTENLGTPLVVKGHIVPDQSRFAGPERTSNPKSSLQPKLLSITGWSQYDCWDNPSAANCDTVDPSTVWESGHRCSDDAVTVISQFAYDPLNGAEDMLVEERWSPHCQTNWTRVTSYKGDWTVSLKTDLFAQNHPYVDYQSSCGQNCTSLWGSMYYAPYEQVNSEGTITVQDKRCCFLPNYTLQATARGYN